MENKPRIVAGICEFCGIPAVDCVHHGQAPTAKEKITIEIDPVIERPNNPLSKKFADVVIAHWDRRDMLYNTLGSLPIDGLNVVIIRGNTYSISNNLGYTACVTDDIIFCNDDMEIPRETLNEMLSSKADFAMARQFYPDGTPQHCGIKWVDNDFVVVTNPYEAEISTAACFRVKRHVFDALLGFNEKFINGGEDHDLFFRAVEAGYTFEFVDTPVIHYCSQSAGRFDYEAENLQLLRELWPVAKLANIFNEIKTKKKKGAQTKN